MNNDTKKQDPYFIDKLGAWMGLAYGLITDWLDPEEGEQSSYTVFEATERLRQHADTAEIMEQWPRNLQQSRTRAALERGRRDGRFATFLGKGKHLTKETRRYELSKKYLDSVKRAKAWAAKQVA